MLGLWGWPGKPKSMRKGQYHQVQQGLRTLLDLPASQRERVGGQFSQVPSYRAVAPSSGEAQEENRWFIVWGGWGYPLQEVASETVAVPLLKATKKSLRLFWILPGQGGPLPKGLSSYPKI